MAVVVAAAEAEAEAARLLPIPVAACSLAVRLCACACAWKPEQAVGARLHALRMQAVPRRRPRTERVEGLA